MKSVKNKQSSLLSKYSALYKSKPESRVFAPLAETYRKLGMHDDAFKILRRGINLHPDYTLGYIVLAHCYFDKGQYELAYNVLRPHVSKNLENISLQKLFSSICEQIGYLEEALQTYKYLLLLNPSDKEIANKVKTLEADLAYEEGEESFTDGPIQKENTFENEDDWVQVTFNSKEQKPITKKEEDDAAQWSMTDKLTDISSRPLKQNVEDMEPIEQKSLDDEYFFEEYDNPAEDVIEAEGQEQQDGPIITHTLVDLFLQQGHKDRAIEILENILQLHPEDQFSRRKLNELQGGHDQLMELIDQKKQKDSQVVAQVENKLQEFLNMLKVTADKQLR